MDAHSGRTEPVSRPGQGCARIGAAPANRARPPGGRFVLRRAWRHVCTANTPVPAGTRGQRRFRTHGGRAATVEGREGQNRWWRLPVSHRHAMTCTATSRCDMTGTVAHTWHERSRPAATHAVGRKL